MTKDDIFNKTSESDPFNREVFDLDKDLSLIEVNERNDGNGCYISKKDDKYTIYEEFIIYNGPLVNFKCSINFSKKSDSKKYIPRIIFYKEDKNGNLKEPQKQKVIIGFTKSGEGLENFWRIISFLKLYKDLVDTGDFDEKYKVISSDAYISEFKSKKDFEKAEELKKLEISEETLKKYLSNERIKTVEKFRGMLEDDKNIEKYRIEEQISEAGEEPVWHHFLKKYDWLLGLNIDVKFICEFTDEVCVGNPDTKGKGNPKTDMMGVSDYTILIEFKTASTYFFTNVKSSKSRAGTWSFTNDFIEGISQCLKQKFDWDKEQKGKDLIQNGKITDQNIRRTVDPKTIFIMGNKQKELNLNNIQTENIIKRDTLERFKRNNRNVEILSFDELYERAYFIVYNKIAPKLIFKNNNENNIELIKGKEEIDFNDIPF